MNRQNGLSAEDLNDRIHSLVSNFKTAAEHLSAAASSLKDTALEAKSHAVSSASTITAKAGKVAAKAGKAIGKTIKDHPIMAIGVALGAGYFVIRRFRR